MQKPLLTRNHKKLMIMIKYCYLYPFNGKSLNLTSKEGVSSIIELNNLPCLELLGRTLCGEVFKNKNVKCLMELIILITVLLVCCLI